VADQEAPEHLGLHSGGRPSGVRPVPRGSGGHRRGGRPEHGLRHDRFRLGRTSTHEIGHWLNLRHIWGDTEDCSGSDFVADTPNAEGPNYGKPTFPHISCGNGPSGDMFVNYMDYVDDDAMFMLTIGQVERMHAALEGLRRPFLK